MLNRLHNKYLVFCVKIFIAVGIFWYLFHSGRLTSEIFLQIVNPDHISLVVLSGSAFLATQLLASFRLIVLLRMIDQGIPFLSAFRLTLIGNFFNFVLPGMVGGDIIKGAYLFRSEKDRRGRSSGVILMDRVMGFVALLFIGTLSIIYLYLAKQDTIKPWLSELHKVFLVSVTILLLFMIVVLLSKNNKFRLFANRVTSNLFKKTMFYHMTDAIGTLTNNIRVLVIGFIISLGVHATALSSILVLIDVIPGNSPNIVSLIAATSIVILFSAIPVTPGNIGWTELVASVGWSIVGSSYGSYIFFYWRILIILFSIPGGLLYLIPEHRIINENTAVKPIVKVIQR